MSHNAELMLIGNKCDISDQRVVSKERGQLLADECNIELFMEISAKENINVQEVSITYMWPDLQKRVLYVQL